MKAKKKPYIWVSWLAPLLTGEDNCYWKVWMKSQFTDLNKIPSNFDFSGWQENHTELLNQLRFEYKNQCRQLWTEGETSWKIEGKTAILAGKMDLVTVGPNLVIDAKTGKPSDSHMTQVKLYILAIQMGALKDLLGDSVDFAGELRYKDGHSITIGSEEVDTTFRRRVFETIRVLGNGGLEPDRVPSTFECKFCDLADCPERVSDKKSVLYVEEF